MLGKMMFQGQTDFDGFMNYKENKADIKFSEYCSIFTFATENLDSYLKELNVVNKKVLTVTSSGDQLINLALLKANEIDCFDINRLCYYYTKLKITGLMFLDYEEVMTGMAREVKEKTGIVKIHLELFDVFSKVERCQCMRMVALAHIGIVDKARVSIMKETLKTSDCDWFPLDNIPSLAYDHNEILTEAIEVLKRRIKETDFLKYMYPDGFTMPEIQKVYESILNKKFDRRNFRKRLLSLGLIEDTKKLEKFDGNKPAKVYRFKNKDEIKNVF